MAASLVPAPLDEGAFAPYGALIAPGAGRGYAVNEGFGRRIDLAALDAEAGAVPRLALYRLEPRVLPLSLDLFERHPASAQAFVPLGSVHLLVVVAETGADGLPDPHRARAFRARPGLGVLYRRDLWHMPLIALDGAGDALMLMAERGAGDTVEHRLGRPIMVRS